MGMSLRLEVLPIEIPEECNTILGQSHFIKTVEDLHEAVVNSVPTAKFGLGFCEASGPCLVRKSGNDHALTEAAAQAALKMGAGHSFILFLRDAYPINLLNAIRHVPEVCNIYCATANPIQVIIGVSEQGRGVLGVIDGSAAKAIESPVHALDRKDFLRKTGYKL